MENERILVTGCGGMLGAAVYEVFSSSRAQVLATDIDLNEPWLSHMDVRDMDECEKVFREFRPTIVLHLAALTDLEYCEDNPKEVWLANALGTENIALLARQYDCLMVYIGTAGIFDGHQDCYTDFDKPNPLSYYGKAKLHGEVFVQQFLTRYYIFRAGWMMGGGPAKDKKFINKIYRKIKAGQSELFVVEDKLGNPTYTCNFAESMFQVIQTGYYGLYNQVSTGSGSRYDVAVEFVNLLGLSDRVAVNVVDSSYFKKEFFAPRPFSEKLVNLKLNARKINFMRNWRECLREYSPVFVEDYNAQV